MLAQWRCFSPSHGDDLAKSAATLPDRPKRLEMDFWHHGGKKRGVGMGVGVRLRLAGAGRIARKGPGQCNAANQECSSLHSLIGQE